MKNKIHKILGVGLALVIATALLAGFVAAPVAASPAETINEWYKFDYPVAGADGDWLYSPDILADGEITEAIDGTLYVHVQRCVPDATFYFVIDPVTATWDNTITVSEFDDSDTGMIYGDFDGLWGEAENDPWELDDLGDVAIKSAVESFLPTDFVASFSWSYGAYDGTACVNGTLTTTSLTFEGSIEDIGGDLGALVAAGPTFTVTGGSLQFTNCGFSFDTTGDVMIDSGDTNLGSSIYKSPDGGRTWEDTEFPGGWVVDMVASSIDADTLYVVDGHYVYKTEDAGDEWDYLGKDSIEEQLAGYCGIPVCCNCDTCEPSCCDSLIADFSCPITSIDVAYDDSENPYVYIGTRKHLSGVDLDDPADGYLDCFLGDVYYLSEAGYPANWTSLNLACYRNGSYDALAVGCAPDWADSKETYVVVSTDDDDNDGNETEGGIDHQTHVIYTKGTICGWYEFAELLYNCVATNHFNSSFASRIAFPDDWEDTETLFVGVVDCDDCSEPDLPPAPNTGGLGGDVYMATEDGAIDMNVLGISSGCVGLQPVDIISLDIMGDLDEASLIAGSWCCNEVHCSEDGGWSWDASDKDPTGAERTYVIWYEDTALATTAGCECAVSMCCGEEYPCEFWTQIGLINTGIDCVRSIGHSPGYVCEDTETFFMLTDWDPGCCCFPCQLVTAEQRCYEETQSVWRHDGEYWERVYSSTIAGADSTTPDANIFESLVVSPDFNETEVVYLWNGCFEMWRTTDAGCSWDKLTFPCAPRACISAAVVIDEDTVIAGGCKADSCCAGSSGYVWKTTRHGARPWDDYEYNATTPGNVVSFALEPGYEDPGLVLLGDNTSRVFISEDGGEEWDLVGAGTATGCQAILESTDQNTYVAFDPDYATSGIIYAAAGSIIARCVVDPDEDWGDQEWEGICGDATGDCPQACFTAAGIQAAGDTVLYVTDSDETSDTHGPKVTDLTYTCDDATTYLDKISDTGGVVRSVNPDEEDADDVIFERIATGLPVGLTAQLDATAELYGLWLTCDTSEDGCAENVLWALDSGDMYPTSDPIYDPCANIWVYEDTLAQPVALVKPLDEQKMTTTKEITLSWDELCGADCYQISLEQYCPECPEDWITVVIEDLDCAPGPCCIVCGPPAAVGCPACPTECPCTTDTCMVIKGLDPASTYRWKVRVCACQPALSKWSEERTFSTALEAVVWGPCSPECGAQDVILSPNFSWSAVENATSYDIELATTETFTAGVVRGSSTVNAWAFPDTLEYGKTYYWRVRAETDGVFSDWMVCLFTTMEEPVEPPPPVEITPAPPAPTITIPPAEMITPNWIYAIIGIGAALCIVVIVLIVRTRRPPA